MTGSNELEFKKKIKTVEQCKELLEKIKARRSQNGKIKKIHNGKGRQ